MTQWFRGINLHSVDVVERSIVENEYHFVLKDNVITMVLDHDDYLWAFPRAIVPAQDDWLVTLSQEGDRLIIEEDVIIAWMVPDEFTEPCMPICSNGVYPVRSDNEHLVMHRRGLDGRLFEIGNRKQSFGTIVSAGEWWQAQKTNCTGI